MVVLNWNAAVGNVTLAPGQAITVPNQFSPISLWPSPEPPLTLARIGEYGIYFRLDLRDPTGNTFLLDADGLKVPYGYTSYRTDDLAANGTLDDRVWVLGRPPGSAANGAYANALNLATLRLGLGNDRFELVGRGLVQSASGDVSLEASRGYIAGSTIEAGPGDDYLAVLMPWQSIFKGGPNTDYGPAGLNVKITADNPIEAVPYGDTIELKGSRTAWDLEFRDQNGDGSVTLASILSEQDVIATSNGNRISGFERLRFADVLLDLVLFRQMATGPAYGEPGYGLFGDAVAPALNSSLGEDLWQAFQFNRTRIAGIQGAPAAPITVRTGSGDDSPWLRDALAYASLLTEGGRDIVDTGSINSASVDTGVGDDSLEVQGDVVGADLAAGAGQDAFRLGSVAFSQVVMGADGDNESDTLEIRGSVSNSTFWGGGGTDTLILDALDPAAFPLTRVTDETGTYHRYGTNRFYGFELLGGAAAMGVGSAVPRTASPASAAVGAAAPPAATAPVNPAADQLVRGGQGSSQRLYGTPGRDVFAYSAAGTLAAADEIHDFACGTDKVLIEDIPRQSPLGKALKGKSSGKALARVKKSKQASLSRSPLVFNTRSGELFYNANGSRKGFGDGGGLIADFLPNVKLSNSDLLFAYANPPI